MLSGASVGDAGGGAVSDSQMREWKEKLMESERLMKTMSMSWEERLRIAHQALEERAQQLKTLGISVQGGGITVDADKFYLMNMQPEGDELTMYYLSKSTRVGSSKSQDIQIRCEGVLPEHCIMPIENGQLHIMPLLDAEVMVDNQLITHQTALSHGSVIRLGPVKEFRVNCPGSRTRASAATPDEHENDDEDEGLTKMSWPGSKFHRACETGDLGQVQLMLSKGFDVNSDDARWKRCPLMLAADKGHKQLCQFLITQGANPGKPDERGYTPLHASADSGHLEICILLVQSGAHPDPSAIVGCTPLQRAADMGHTEVCRFLISKGANVNAQDKAKGWTPLLLASLRGHVPIIEMLLENGADVSIRNRFDECALHMAAEPGHVDVIRALLKAGCDPTSQQAYGRTPFDYASETTSFILLHSTHERATRREEACRILFPLLTHHQRSTRSLTDRRTIAIAQAPSARAAAVSRGDQVLSSARSGGSGAGGGAGAGAASRPASSRRSVATASNGSGASSSTATRAASSTNGTKTATRSSSLSASPMQQASARTSLTSGTKSPRRPK
jgi:ankyrin repeat protein